MLPLFRTSELPTAHAEAGPPFDLQLPFPSGQAWRFSGGPHPSRFRRIGSHVTLGANSWSGLDFFPPGSYWNYFVTAMASGTVIWANEPSCPNLVLIDHGDGWLTGYYHLTQIRVSEGQSVLTGAALGHPGGAIGCGGESGGPHVHIFVLHDWEQIPVEGITFSGWQAVAGAAPYEGYMRDSSDSETTVRVKGAIHRPAPSCEQRAHSCKNKPPPTPEPASTLTIINPAKLSVADVTVQFQYKCPVPTQIVYLQVKVTQGNVISVELPNPVECNGQKGTTSVTVVPLSGSFTLGKTTVTASLTMGNTTLTTDTRTIMTVQ
jgi:hypothetical protein